ncbi:AtpZ/AtpI family protein [Pseudokineococcus sp. 1T1Z-3]|uniref:AtpZ/AtpI family protein n=1 Tax=Pseudokineococcus sp. 1T1Z-3 TaxID=3132745 RepID=UPI0030B1EA06
MSASQERRGPRAGKGAGPGRPVLRPAAEDVPVRAGGGGGDLVAYNVLAYLMSGLLLFGGSGYLLDRWLGTSLLTLVGLLLGMGLGLYLVWVRYGGRRPPEDGGDGSTAGGPAPGGGSGA